MDKFQPIGLNEIREKFLKFFQSKDHFRKESASLIPDGDKSLLLINSGMAPLKKYFTGEVQPPYRRMTTCQKCIRLIDIENVGITSRHGSFFEMLGNFSFGDYFKEDAIKWAWEFLTEELKLPKSRLWPSVYTEDDEAEELWKKLTDADPEHIVRLGKDDNFWEIGEGACGPCSEIYYDRGEKYGCGKSDCKPGCDCDRYVEVWNLVFSQYYNDGKGNYSPLKQKNIDTGMGLERIACVMQDKDSIFEVDTNRRILDEASAVSRVAYNADRIKDISLRIITDHAKSTVFLTADGVLPSNEGRGYILRKLIRRAARHGRLLGIEGPFMAKMAAVVIKENMTAYPELEEKKDYIKRVIEAEENKFAETIDQGLGLLEQLINRLKEEHGSILSGEDAFRLYDTYGFPLDLTEEIVVDAGIAVDKDGFAACMEKQRNESRKARAEQGDFAWEKNEAYKNIIKSTEFVGYETLEAETIIENIIFDGSEVAAAGEGQKIAVVLDKTPFYAESGGQAGDCGKLENDSTEIIIENTKKGPSGAYLHIGRIISGEIKAGDKLKASVNKKERLAASKNHTATHLLHKALKLIVGEHVSQAGSSVDSSLLRFDYTSFEALSKETLSSIEDEVNDSIIKALKVKTELMSLEDAKKSGATALFSEKYGQNVRVVNIADYSSELCGGTHVENTSEIGLFKIVSESSVAAGVRRIEAVTSLNVLKLLNSRIALIESAAVSLKAGNPLEIDKRAEHQAAEIRELNKKLDALRKKLAASSTEDIFSSPVKIGEINLYKAHYRGTDSSVLKDIGDKIKDKDPYAVGIVAVSGGDKPGLIAVCGSEAVKRGLHAGKLVGEVAAMTGGRGGGKPDIAMAGVGDPDKIDQAFEAIVAIIENM